MSIPTFAPGVNPSFSYPIKYEWAVDSQRFIKPYSRTIPKGLKFLRNLRTNWILSRDQKEYVESFFHRIIGPSGLFYFTPLDPVASPLDAGPELAQVTRAGAPVGARTYYINYTWYDSTTGMETKPSPVSTIAMLGGKVVHVTVPVFPEGADRARIYAGTILGTEWLQAASPEKTWEEPISGLLTLTSLAPSTNTLYPAVMWTLVGAIEPVKISANRYSLELEFLEAWV